MRDLGEVPGAKVPLTPSTLSRHITTSFKRINKSFKIYVRESHKSINKYWFWKETEKYGRIKKGHMTPCQDKGSNGNVMKPAASGQWLQQQAASGSTRHFTRLLLLFSIYLLSSASKAQQERARARAKEREINFPSAVSSPQRPTVATGKTKDRSLEFHSDLPHRQYLSHQPLPPGLH